MDTGRLTGSVRTALVTFGLAHILVGLGMLALTVGSPWDEAPAIEVLLAAAGIATVFLGVRLIRPTRSDRAALRLALPYAALLLVLGLLFVTLDTVTEGALDTAGTGIVWILAATAVLVVARRPTAPETLAATGLVAAALVLAGLSMAAPLHLVPFRPWDAIGRFHTGIGVLGGTALLVGAAGAAAGTVLPDRMRRAWVVFVAVAATLYAIAALRASLRFLGDFDWRLLSPPSDLFRDSALLGTSMALLLAGFLAWAAASVAALVAAAQILVRAAARFPWPRWAAAGARPVGDAPARRCPNCQAALRPGRQPVCPECLYQPA